MATIAVSELTVKVAATPPKYTAVAPVNPLPVIVTGVPPAVDPVLVLRPVTLGADAAEYVNRPAEVGGDDPLYVVTVTSTTPAYSAGVVALICVSDTTVNVASKPPNRTPVAPLNPLPVIVTVVPPADDHVVVDSPVIDGSPAAL